MQLMRLRSTVQRFTLNSSAFSCGLTIVECTHRAREPSQTPGQVAALQLLLALLGLLRIAFAFKQKKTAHLLQLSPVASTPTTHYYYIP